MRLTGLPSWVAGSARNANACCCDEPCSASAACGVFGDGGSRMLGSNISPASKTALRHHLNVLRGLCWVLPEASHDPVAACAQAHTAQSCALEGIPFGVGHVRVRIRGAA